MKINKLATTSIVAFSLAMSGIGQAADAKNKFESKTTKNKISHVGEKPSIKQSIQSRSADIPQSFNKTNSANQLREVGVPAKIQASHNVIPKNGAIGPVCTPSKTGAIGPVCAPKPNQSSSIVSLKNNRLGSSTAYGTETGNPKSAYGTETGNPPKQHRLGGHKNASLGNSASSKEYREGVNNGTMALSYDYSAGQSNASDTGKPKEYREGVNEGFMTPRYNFRAGYNDFTTSYSLASKNRDGSLSITNTIDGTVYTATEEEGIVDVKPIKEQRTGNVSSHFMTPNADFSESASTPGPEAWKNKDGSISRVSDDGSLVITSVNGTTVDKKEYREGNYSGNSSTPTNDFSNSARPDETSITYADGTVKSTYRDVDGVYRTDIKSPREGNHTPNTNVPHLDLTSSSDDDDEGSNDDDSDSNSDSDSDDNDDDNSDSNSENNDDDSEEDNSEEESEDSNSESEEDTTDEEEPEGEEDESTGADDRAGAGRGTARKLLENMIANQSTGSDGCGKQPGVLVNPMGGVDGGCSNGSKPKGPEKEENDMEDDVLFGERIGTTSADPMDIISQPVNGDGMMQILQDEQSTTTYFEMVGNPGDR